MAQDALSDAFRMRSPVAHETSAFPGRSHSDHSPGCRPSASSSRALSSARRSHRASTIRARRSRVGRITNIINGIPVTQPANQTTDTRQEQLTTTFRLFDTGNRKLSIRQSQAGAVGSRVRRAEHAPDRDQQCRDELFLRTPDACIGQGLVCLRWSAPRMRLKLVQAQVEAKVRRREKTRFRPMPISRTPASTCSRHRTTFRSPKPS